MKTLSMKNLVIQVAGLFIVIGVVMFAAAGTVSWKAGWAYLILFFLFTVSLSVWLIQYNPGLLNERLSGMIQKEQKSSDKVFVVIAQVLFFGWLIFMALDGGRYHWSQVPDAVQVIGGIVLLISFYLFYLVFKENSYLSPVVRVQEERGHSVITTGPYHYVRHPMYSAFIVYAIGVSLLLGSWYGLVPALLLVIAIGWRATQEEKTLRDELQGYDTYMTQVRYRLIPYVW